MNLLKREPILLKLALKVCLLKLLQIYTLNILKFHLQNAHLGISELGAKVVVFLKVFLLGHASLLKSTAVKLSVL